MYICSSMNFENYIVMGRDDGYGIWIWHLILLHNYVHGNFVVFYIFTSNDSIISSVIIFSPCGWSIEIVFIGNNV